MQGETLMMTGKLLGHRHTATTQRYAHLEGRFLLDAAERIAQLILERTRPSGSTLLAALGRERPTSTIPLERRQNGIPPEPTPPQDHRAEPWARP